MSPYRAVRIVVEPGPSWWRAAPPEFWSSLAGAAIYAAGFCGPSALALVYGLDSPAIAAFTLLLGGALAAIWAAECRAIWVREVRPACAPRTRILPAGDVDLTEARS